MNPSARVSRVGRLLVLVANLGRVNVRSLVRLGSRRCCWLLILAVLIFVVVFEW